MTREQWRLLGGVALLFGAWALTRDCDGDLREVLPDSEFDPRALEAGTLVEHEHTGSRGTAKKIAKHHLMEDELYYQKLATIHRD